MYNLPRNRTAFNACRHARLYTWCQRLQDLSPTDDRQSDWLQQMEFPFMPTGWLQSKTQAGRCTSFWQFIFIRNVSQFNLEVKMMEAHSEKKGLKSNYCSGPWTTSLVIWHANVATGCVRRVRFILQEVCLTHYPGKIWSPRSWLLFSFATKDDLYEMSIRQLLHLQNTLAWEPHVRSKQIPTHGLGIRGIQAQVLQEVSEIWLWGTDEEVQIVPWNGLCEW